MNTYEISKEFYELQQLIELEEFDENGELIDNSGIIEELLNSLESERNIKADSIAYLIKIANESQNSIKDEITRLNERKTMFLKQENKLKELLAYLLQGEKLKTDRFTFSYRKSTSVHILDESLIPAKFLKVKKTVTVTVDKMAIKKMLVDFETVAGAELETKNSLTVK